VLTLSVRETLPATPRARIVRLDLHGKPFPYLPGQAVLVGPHGQPKRRPYSIADAPEEAERQDWLELLVGAGDGSLQTLGFAPGSLIDVEGPVGRFVFPSVPPERRFLFIAGGTGIAPLRAMLRHALRVPHDHIGLFYSARGPGEFAYEEEFRALANERVIELCQAITRDEPASGWIGIRGRIGPADLGALIHNPATLCFVCGPPTLVHEMPRLLESLGIRPDRIRVEAWQSDSPAASNGPP
jgi:ferredoxin-NADP reductase